jgi:hypothetical protein
MVRYLQNNEIDKLSWDSCVNSSLNSLPGALSWYLDLVCPGWNALVLDDYAAVMPLTGKRKLGIDYLFQPYFTQQLGIFSPLRLTQADTGQFLASIPGFFKYIDICLNAANKPLGDGFTFTARQNYQLDLSASYIYLANAYHRNCRRNIQKAIHGGLEVKRGPSPAIFTRFIHQYLDNKLVALRKSFYPLLLKVTSASLQHNNGEILGVYARDGSLLAAGWFLNGAGRCVFEVCASSESGRENQAMYLIVDQMIRNLAGTGVIFDFAGSNLPGVAYFNAGFGAYKQIYYAVKKNLLPWPLKMIKK